MSFREAMLPNHPPGALPLDPAGGPPFPDPLCPHLQILAAPLAMSLLLSHDLHVRLLRVIR